MSVRPLFHRSNLKVKLNYSTTTTSRKKDIGSGHWSRAQTDPRPMTFPGSAVGPFGPGPVARDIGPGPVGLIGPGPRQCPGPMTSCLPAASHVALFDSLVPGQG